MSSPIEVVLQVVPAELRVFGAALGTGSGQIAALNVAPEFESAAGALAGADVAAMLGQAAESAKTAFAAVEERLRGLSNIAQGNAQSYEDADSWRIEEGEN